MAIKNQINTYADLTAYNNDQNKEYPNVSYIVATDEVKWQATEPIDQVHVVAKYNVTSTETATKLFGATTTDDIQYQIIDGIRQQSVQTTYTFDTLGEHVVKYKINGTILPRQMFRGCNGLTSVTIPDIITGFGEEVFGACTRLTSVVMSDSLTSISGYTFNNCTGLTSITIPDSVTSIGQNAFNSCSGLTSITIPNSVTSIGVGAFGVPRLIGVTHITVGTGVTEIGDGAFRSYNTNDTQCDFTIYATVPPTLGTNVFQGKNNLTIYVPAASVSAYQTAWSDYASRIQAIPTT